MDLIIKFENISGIGLVSLLLIFVAIFSLPFLNRFI